VLDTEEKDDPDLIRTVGALNDGLRGTGQVCGALTGGMCVLSYYAGQGTAEEMADPDYDNLAQELYDWFKQLIAERYAGISCPDILEGDQANKLARCPGLVEETFGKAVQLLEEHDLL